jgi:hypothetical protein
MSKATIDRKAEMGNEPVTDLAATTAITSRDAELQGMAEILVNLQTLRRCTLSGDENKAHRNGAKVLDFIVQGLVDEKGKARTGDVFEAASTRLTADDLAAFVRLILSIPAAHVGVCTSKYKGSKLPGGILPATLSTLYLQRLFTIPKVAKDAQIDDTMDKAIAALSAQLEAATKAE